MREHLVDRYRIPGSKSKGMEVTRAQVRVPSNHKHRSARLKGMSPGVFLGVKNVFRNQKYRVQHSGGLGPKGGQGIRKCTSTGQVRWTRRTQRLSRVHLLARCIDVKDANRCIDMEVAKQGTLGLAQQRARAGGLGGDLGWGICRMSGLETPTSPTPGIRPCSTQDPKGIT